MTYEESINYLNKTAGFAKKSPMDNIKYFLECLGNPQNNLQLIHVAGTNGKGSTCMFLEALLKEKGIRTGVFTSPHLLCVNERIRINGENIKNQLFAEVFEEVSEVVKKAVNDGKQHPSFFEMLFLMAMVAFQKEQLEYCVVETGMGGRYDATNMILPKVCILTTVSMDHMEFLGESLDKIAYHKAGIIKEGVTVFSASQEKECISVIREEAKKKNAPLEILSEDNLNFIEKYGKYIDFLNTSAYDKKRVAGKNVAGQFQRENLALALKAAEYILGTFEESVIFHALEKISIPGRMEEVLPGVYVDVAHNIQGIEAFCSTVDEHFKGRKRILFGASHKNEEDHMRHILESMNELETFQTVSINGRSVDEIGFRDAFEEMMRVKDKETICFVVGSFYLVGVTKQYISRRKEYVKL